MYIRQHEQFRRNFITPLGSPLEGAGAGTSNPGSGPMTPSLLANPNALTTPPPVGDKSSQTSFFPPVHSESNRRRHRTPIIGLSGNARKELVDEAYASGMDDYIIKPFKLAELGKVLKKWERNLDEQMEERSLLGVQKTGHAHEAVHEASRRLQSEPVATADDTKTAEETTAVPIRPSLSPLGIAQPTPGDIPLQTISSLSSSADGASLKSTSSSDAPSSSSLRSNSSANPSSPASSAPTAVSSVFNDSSIGGGRPSKQADSS